MSAEVERNGTKRNGAKRNKSNVRFSRIEPERQPDLFPLLDLINRMNLTATFARQIGIQIPSFHPYCPTKGLTLRKICTFLWNGTE